MGQMTQHTVSKHWRK